MNVRLRCKAGCLGCEATNPPIGHALANDTEQHQFGAFVVVHADCHSVGVAEVELAKVALEVLRAYTMFAMDPGTGQG